MKTLYQKLLPKAIGRYYNLLAIFAPRTASLKAFRLFSKPRRGAIGVHHQEFLDPARDKRIAMGDITIQTYKWTGKGKTIVLIHGWESHSHRWKMLIEQLRKQDYNVVAFDAPAHGYSTGNSLYVPLYDKALSLVLENYKPEFLIGHSVGGMTAIFNQSRNPAPYVEKLVILGPPDKFSAILDEYQRILGLHDRVVEALDLYFQENFGISKDELAASAFAKNLSIPGLLVHDKGDTITSVNGSRNIHANWKDSEILETEGLGHSLYDAGVNQKIVDYLNDSHSS